jgi:formylglycine-generating enzyme required for sulfatase activity
MWKYSVRWFLSLAAAGLLAGCYNLTLTQYAGDGGGQDAGASSGNTGFGGTGGGGTTSSGGAASTGGISGAGGASGGLGGSDAGVRDAPVAQPDATMGGIGGGGTTSSGGAASTGGISGAGGASGGLGGSDAGVRDAPVVQPDVALGGTGGSTGGIGGGGGAISVGGSTTTGGTTGSGGASSSGGTSLNGGTPPSCSGLAATCGPSGNESCCTSLLVPGGTFYRSYDGVDFTDKSYPATVDSFYLDKYEITVGRFRQFVNQGMGTQTSPPSAGDGVHPGITGSGWDSTWKTNLAANTAALTTNLKCYAGYQTWTDTAGSNESKPVNCLDWYTAFAFCAWDGGRLPTEAEWNYAASGGNEQRYYPWSSPATSTTIDDSYAVYCGGSCNGTQNVGLKSPKGDGKWGQSDLAGNVWEWTLDWYAIPYSMPCNNCADLTVASSRVIRGGLFNYFASYLRSAFRYYGNPWYDFFIGARCARTNL